MVQVEQEALWVLRHIFRFRNDLILVADRVFLMAYGAAAEEAALHQQLTLNTEKERVISLAGLGYIIIQTAFTPIPDAIRAQTESLHNRSSPSTKTGDRSGPVRKRPAW